jgi:hypothetical protein
MSDLNDLIHTNAQNAFGIGVKTERERIIKLLSEVRATWVKPTQFNYPNELENLIELIKAEK